VPRVSCLTRFLLRFSPGYANKMRCMGKTLKWLLRGIIVLVLLALVPVLSLPTVINSEWSKSFVSRKLSESLGVAVKLQGDLKLQLGSPLRLSVSKGFIANPWPAEQHMLMVGDMSIAAPLFKNLSGDYQIQELSLNDVEILVTEDERGRLNWDFSQKAAAQSDSNENSALVLPMIKEIQLNNIKLSVKVGEGDRQLFFRNLSARNIGSDLRSSIDTSLSIDGVPLNLKGGTGPLEALLSGEDLELNLDLQQADNHVSARGSLNQAGAFSLKLFAEGDDFSTLSPLIQTDLPAWSDYKLSGRIERAAEKKAPLELKGMKLSIGEHDLSGDLSLIFDPLSLVASLHSDNFDLGVLDSAEASGDRPVEESKPADTRQEPRIPFEILEALNANIQLEAKKLKTFLDLELDDLRLSLSLQDGKLSVPILNADAIGGSFEASLQAANETMQVKLSGKEFLANPITELAGGRTIIDGKFDLSLDLLTTGSLLSEILETLQGDLEITSEMARIQSSTLQNVSSGLFKILSPLLGESEQAEVECLVYGYEIKDGIAKSEDQVIKLGEVFIFAEGELNFSANELKYNFNVHSNNPAVASLIPPFRAYGTLNNPHFAPSISGSVASIADTAQVITGSTTGIISKTAEVLSGDKTEQLSGLAVCRKAFEDEQDLLSSQVGKMLE